jgi:flagellum-specific ATP synthase
MSAPPSLSDQKQQPAPLARLHMLEERLVALRSRSRIRRGGVVIEVTPAYCRVAGLSEWVTLGDTISLDSGGAEELGEVVRIDSAAITVKPFESPIKAALGTPAWHRGPVTLSPHASWKGRMINALGLPVDGGGDLTVGERTLSTHAEPPSPLDRQRVTKPVLTGVRVIDLFTPLCAGQRIGIFAGSGIGKSTLLGMLARARGFDTVVVALVGERGREVREFIEDSLGAERKRAVTVVSTGDESPMMRRLAPKTAMTVAEYFRDQGDSVLLIVDSVTRFAHAARDVAMAAGEPPVARGYAPSVFSDLPKLLERAGPGLEGRGSITGVFAVLVDGDDHNDPVADSIRGTLDGHIILDRAIADEGRFPAVNVLGSVSRLSQHVWTPEQQTLMRRLKAMVARFEDTRDLRLIGGYKKGTDADLDNAIDHVPRVYDYLRQGPGEPPSSDAFQGLARALAPKPPTQPQVQPGPAPQSS